jgi:hypothetical protein
VTSGSSTQYVFRFVEHRLQTCATFFERWRQPWPKTKPGPLLSEPRLRNVVGCGKLFDLASEAGGVQGGGELGFGEITFDSEGFGFGDDVVAGDAGNILHSSDGGISALFAAEMHAGDRGFGEFRFGLGSGIAAGGFFAFNFAEVTGGEDGLDGFLGIGLLLGGDGDGLAFGSDGDVFADAGAGFDDAVGAALAAVMHAGHGDSGLRVSERGDGKERKDEALHGAC